MSLCSLFQPPRLNKGEKMFNVSVRIPTMLVKGQYELDMQILVLKISGRGDFSLDLSMRSNNLKINRYNNLTNSINYR